MIREQPFLFASKLAATDIARLRRCQMPDQGCGNVTIARQAVAERASALRIARRCQAGSRSGATLR